MTEFGLSRPVEPTQRTPAESTRFFVLALRLLPLLPLLVSVAIQAQPPNSSGTNEAVVLPKSVPDPLEPVNRLVWSVNKGVISSVVRPTARLYRGVVIKPVRTGISNFGRNLTYPTRLLNNLLQGKWNGALDESLRFFYNTTVGLAGFIDVAEKNKMPKSPADFGQTLAHWGWQPNFFLMLPILGPSNDRDGVGFAVDTISNPWNYYAPYEVDASTPPTYFVPYTYVNYGVIYNDLSDNVEELARFSQSEMDSYSQVQYAWTFARSIKTPDFQVKGPQDEGSLETLESSFFTYKDPAMTVRATTQSVRLPATGKDLKYTFWMQQANAPVLYIIPGLGSHRLAKAPIALAELAYNQGFSAVIISSAFNSEFMEHASTAAMPAYVPTDGHDLHVALTAIDRQLRARYSDRMGKTALMGYSMGALHSLYIAATSSTNTEPLLKFDRYVALDTPVRLMHGVSKLDEFYQAPLSWPSAERAGNLENTFLKVAAVAKGGLSPQGPPPFSAVESKFLIGLTFRLMLRDIIYSSQKRHNQGVLKQPIANLKRGQVYEEILKYSYADYFRQFAVPFYRERGLGAETEKSMEQAGELKTYESSLKANQAVRVIVNQNDFLLAGEDLAWLRSTFPPERLTVYPNGGHLGNFAKPDVQASILKALEDLGQTKPNK